MVPMLSLRVSDFTLVNTASLAAPTPKCPMASNPRGEEAAVNDYGLTPGPHNRSNHDFEQCSRVIAAPPRGECR